MTKIINMYEAFIRAGLDKDGAREATDAIIDTDNAITEVKNELKLHRWMIGANLAVSSALFWKLFFPG